jgi:hypothetical protein
MVGTSFFSFHFDDGALGGDHQKMDLALMATSY